MKKTPAYLSVYESLKNNIISENYKVGSLLPTESELGVIYNVSRTTIRKAEEMLAAEGYIRIQQGHGTTVLHKRISQHLNKLTSVSQTLKGMGYTVGTSNTYITVVPCPPEVADALMIQPESPVVVVNRIQTADGECVTIAKNYILRALVPNIEINDDKITSLYEYLQEKYNIKYTSAVDTISACSATYEDAMLLHTKPGDALLTINRICYIDDTPSEFDKIKILARKYEFEIYLNG